MRIFLNVLVAKARQLSSLTFRLQIKNSQRISMKSHKSRTISSSISLIFCTVVMIVGYYNKGQRRLLPRASEFQFHQDRQLFTLQDLRRNHICPLFLVVECALCVITNSFLLFHTLFELPMCCSGGSWKREVVPDHKVSMFGY